MASVISDIPPIVMMPGTRSALVIVDMQEFFFQLPERCVNLETIVANINRLVTHFDERGLPVFHVISMYQADGSDWDIKMKAAGRADLIAGTPETAILPQISVQPHHYRLTKTRYSAFFKTDLAERLRGLDIQRVVVVGAYTHYCVNFTIFDAYSHDFIPAIITDAVSSHMADQAEMMIYRMQCNGYHVLTTDQFLRE